VGWDAEAAAARFLILRCIVVVDIDGQLQASKQANFGQNRSRNATVRVPTDGHTDRLTDAKVANRFHNLSHAIYCSYGADKRG